MRGLQARRLPKFCAKENDGEGFDPGDVGTRDYDDATDQSGKRHAPRAGNWDGRQYLSSGLGWCFLDLTRTTHPEASFT